MEMGCRDHHRNRGNRRTPQGQPALAFGDRNVFQFFEDVLVGPRNQGESILKQAFRLCPAPFHLFKKTGRRAFIALPASYKE